MNASVSRVTFQVLAQVTHMCSMPHTRLQKELIILCGGEIMCVSASKIASANTFVSASKTSSVSKIASADSVLSASEVADELKLRVRIIV